MSSLALMRFVEWAPRRYDTGMEILRLAHPERCIRCAACIVQCPTDALDLRGDDGRRVDPETIRFFELYLLGRRAVVAD